MSIPTSSSKPLAFATLGQTHSRGQVMEVLYRSAPRHVRSLELTGTEKLSDLGFSSLRLIGLIVALEDNYGLCAESLLSLSGDTTLDDLIALCVEFKQQPASEQVRAA